MVCLEPTFGGCRDGPEAAPSRGRRARTEPSPGRPRGALRFGPAGTPASRSPTRRARAPVRRLRPGSARTTAGTRPAPARAGRGQGPPPSRSALRSSRPEAQAFRRHKLVFPDGNTSVPAVRRLMRSRTGVSRRTTGNKSTGNTPTGRRCAGPPARRWSPAALRRGGNTAGAAHSRRPAGPRPRRCERPRRHAAVQGTRLLSGSY